MYIIYLQIAVGKHGGNPNKLLLMRSLDRDHVYVIFLGEPYYFFFYCYSVLSELGS